MASAGEFAASVEDGLKLAKRIGAPPPHQAPPRHAAGMERSTGSATMLPAAPMAYAVVADPASVDNPDVPSYQPHVYGRCDPPALIPLQLKEIALEVECLLGEAFVVARGRWWVHCIMRNRSCDCRLAVPMGEQGSIQGIEVNVGKRSYATQVIETEEQSTEKISKFEAGGFLKPDLFFLTIREVDGGSDISFTIRWSQKLQYADGLFSVDIPFRFPHYVNPISKIFTKKEKIQLTLNSGTGKEVLLQRTSHAFKEKGRLGEKMVFLYESPVENWSDQDIHFSYSVYSGDLFGGILLQSPPLQDIDQRDMFCLFLYPGNNQKRKVFQKAVVFIVDTSGSMQGKPLENVRSAVSAALLEMGHGDSFNIIAFNGELRSFSSYLEPATEEMVENAKRWMSTNFVAEGGTEISHPLNEAISLLSRTRDSLPHIFLITDGAVEDERNICSTMRTQLTSRGSISPRISTFGIGPYCNHYFLQMLASIGRGQYDAAYDTDLIENRMQQWFRRSLSTLVADVTIDAFSLLDEIEVYPCDIPDISAHYPVFVSGRYQGKFPDSLKAKGYLADMSEIAIDLKVHNAKDIPLEKVLVKQQIDLLTAQAWFSESKQLEKKVSNLSIRSSFPSEYTYMILLQTDSEKLDTEKEVKKGESRKLPAPDARLPALVRGVNIGFGNIIATRENLPPGFGEAKPPETFEIINKAVNCCGSLADSCCCMCCIKTCSKINDQCFLAITQLCAALSCLACFECCSELCCSGSD
ncbi:Inter alpha-trypsin inhibitor, heavy chain 4 [Ananas comosus]|uniref:Inter alpha-trypsin inhibitor, heavy chain 4 n=1 Tax=Ananas comosus TaxID=4615 RepID=A0A199VI49_ANACO|nr:Inter alpha-trypsin inhibitor, heavy chain 4 [Ananas comosus]